MKILKIHFQNIHSLKGEHTIDFTVPPLSETGIFAIVGDTGAGKSTILDVIVLALFGQMPRFNEKITDATVEKFGTVLTRGTLKAFAEVVYSVGDKIYKSLWAIEKKRKNFSYFMELAELPSGNIIESYKSRVPEKNEKIIGLNYEQFLKSIILAQGSFARFLKASPEERTLMLEKITGTGIYRIIGQRAFEVAKMFSEKLQTKKALIDAVDLLSDDEKNSIYNELSEKNEKIPVLKKKIQTIENKLKKTERYEQLNDEVNLLKKSLLRIQEDLKDFEEQENLLNLHEKILPLKSDLLTVRNLRKDSESKQQKYEVVKEQMSAVKSAIEKLNAELKSKNEFSEKLKSRQSEILPFVDEYRDLSGKRDFLMSLNLDKEKNLKKQIAELKKIENEIEKKKADVKELRKSKEISEKYLNENSKIKELKQDYVLIDQLLKNYDIAKKTTQRTIKESSFAKELEKVGFAVLPQKINDLKNILEQKINTFSDVFASEFDYKETQKELEKNTVLLSETEKLASLSEEILNLERSIQKFDGQLLDLSDKIEKTKELNKKIKNEREIKDKLFNELKIKKERQLLEAKYEQDRLRLKENEPCPLCGSLHHPFAGKTIKSPVDRTEEELKKVQSELKNLEMLNQKAVADLSSFISSYENILQQKNDLEKNFKEKIKQFNDLKSGIGVDFNYPEKNKILDYHKKISDLIGSQKKRIEDYNEYMRLTSAMKELTGIDRRLTEVLRIYEEAKAKLSVYSAYYKQSSNVADILTQLKNAVDEYERRSENLQKIDVDLAKQNETLILLEKSKSIVLQEVESLKSEIDRRKSEIEILSKKINELSAEYFENKQADIFMQDLKTKIDKIVIEIYELQNLISAKNENLKQNQAKLRELTDEIAELQGRYDEISQNLHKKLQNLHISGIDEAWAYLLNDAKVDEIRQRAKQLNEEFVKIKQSLADKNKELSQLLETDKDIFDKKDFLIKDLQTLKSEEEALNRSIGALTEKLKDEEQKRKQLERQIKEYEQLKAEAGKWQELNVLIGDSKGKKFAEKAQQFTLTELILLANSHLQRFSKRYVLDKTNDPKNNLFVYDKYLGMSRRSVHTLSGGETFLVSMSLALALSDLASRQTKISSLFIDEGFGTLDENTLDTALVYLERLHNDYDRTIGIISHVQAIKERISTKISVEKESSGFSKINILSF